MMWNNSLVLVTLVLGVTVAQKAPTISFISPDVAADIGGSAELTCNIKDRQEYPIMWVRLEEGGGSGFTISYSRNLMPGDNRFSLDYDEKQGTYTLSIKDVKVSDGGTYQCQVLVAIGNKITDDVKLQVRVAPVMTDRGSPRSVRAVTGNQAQLQCVAEGFPSPRIIWRRSDGRLMHNGKEEITTQKLIIPKVRKEDRGQYVCRGHNGVGEDDPERTVTLEVEFAPYITIPRPRVAQAPEYDSELVCHIHAFPPPSIFWKKDNVTVTNTGNHQISHFASQGEVITSTLKIAETREDQYGNYTCEAANRHGEAKENLELYQSKIPICPPVCGDIVLTAATTRMQQAAVNIGVAVALLTVL